MCSTDCITKKPEITVAQASCLHSLSKLKAQQLIIGVVHLSIVLRWFKMVQFIQAQNVGFGYLEKRLRLKQADSDIFFL